MWDIAVISTALTTHFPPGRKNRDIPTNDDREIMINFHLLEDRMLGIEERQDLIDMLLLVLIKQGFHLVISQQSNIR